MTVGTRIREARERKGWSQRTLAAHARTNHEAIRRIESGADPRWSLLARLCARLEIPAKDLRQMVQAASK